MRSILPLQLALVMTCVTLVHFLRPGRTRRYQPGHAAAQTVLWIMKLVEFAFGND